MMGVWRHRVTHPEVESVCVGDANGYTDSDCLVSPSVWTQSQTECETSVWVGGETKRRKNEGGWRWRNRACTIGRMGYIGVCVSVSAVIRWIKFASAD